MATRVKAQRRHVMGTLKRKSNEDLVHLATDRRVVGGAAQNSSGMTVIEGE